MEELKKVYNHYHEYMREAEKAHHTDINIILNGDEGTPCGDWTEKEISAYTYALHRASVMHEAMQILAEEIPFLK